MHLELLVNNDSGNVAIVQAFAERAVERLRLDSMSAASLSQLITRSAEAAIRHAYPEDEEGSVKITITRTRGKLTIVIRDYGMPEDVREMERAMHGEDDSNVWLFGIPCSELADEFHWVGYGPKGKALRIIKWLDDCDVRDSTATDDGLTDGLPSETTTETQYTIRRMALDEAVQVSQLIYRAYGDSYFNRDVYYPERVAAKNEQGEVISFVAVDDENRLVGHYALELNQEGPVGEGGQAVVAPAHRGRGLMTRMKSTATETARDMELIGLYADAVTVHTRTQKSNVEHSGHLTCVDLGIAPKGEHFHGIAEKQAQRVTCLLYFRWLQPPAPRTIYVPTSHRPIIEEIYRNMDCPASFAKGSTPHGEGKGTVNVEPHARKAIIRVETVGANTIERIAQSQRELLKGSRVEAIFVELRLSDPCTPSVAEGIEEYKFAFAGIAPHFSSDGDILRMVYLSDPLEREPIKTYDTFGARFLHYVLNEQDRVHRASDED